VRSRISVLTLMSLVALSACSSSHGTHRDAAGAGGDSSYPAPTASNPYPEIPGSVAVYAAVPTTTVRTGQTFTSDIVLVNGLGTSFDVAGATCNGWLSVGLASKAIPFTPSYTAVGCAPTTVRTGVTRLHRPVAARYASCSEKAHATATVADPACISGYSLMPPLPSGRYRLDLDTSQVPHVIVRTPITITLTNS
jgi:hypothetical protein